MTTVLFFDLETVPNFEAAALAGIEPPPALPEPLPLDQCPNLDAVLSKSIAEIKEWLLTHNPEPEYVGRLMEHESDAKKPRKGVFDAIEAFEKSLDTTVQQHESYHKLLATTPELCRVVAAAWCDESGELDSRLVYDEMTEQQLLSDLWKAIDSAKRVCGYYISGFDIPVLYARSCLLDVDPPRMLNTSRYSHEIIDLYRVRWGYEPARPGQPRGMKAMAKLYGVRVPLEDMDGSQVFETYTETPELVEEYVRSDVLVAHALYNRWRGYFRFEP